MDIALTSRQRRMLAKLIDLCKEAGGAIHYTVIARCLGIRNTSAYEMLKLLEREGYVASEYVLTGNAGPGRSSVVFAPTYRARVALHLPATHSRRNAEWESAKRQILSRLGEGESGERALLEELAHLPDAADPLVCCAEMLTALFLNIGREARQRLQEPEMVLRQFVAGPQVENSLNLLPGLALGLAIPGKARRLSEKLIEYSRQCQNYLQQLDSVKQKALADFVRQVLDMERSLTRPEASD